MGHPKKQRRRLRQSVNSPPLFTNRGVGHPKKQSRKLLNCCGLGGFLAEEQFGCVFGGAELCVDDLGGIEVPALGRLLERILRGEMGNCFAVQGYVLGARYFVELGYEGLG